MQASINIYTCMVFQGGSNTLAWYPAVERYISSEQMQVARRIGFSPIGIVMIMVLVVVCTATKLTTLWNDLELFPFRIM